MKDHSLIKKLGNGTWSEKINAASAIFEDFEKYSSELVLGLTDDDADIRYWSLKILSEKDAVKFGGFAETLVEDENWFVRCQAVYSLYLADKKKYSDLIRKIVSLEKDENAADFFKSNIIY